MWKHFITDYLSFSKKERTGILVLVFLIGFFIGLPFLYPLFIKPRPTNATIFKKAIASLSIKQADHTKQFSNQNEDEKLIQSYNPSVNNQPVKGELFYFDPNTTGIEDWKRLGVRDNTITTIQHFLSKGGRFYKREDIGKIWGLHPNEVKRLIPYIQIQTPQATHFSDKKEFKKKLSVPSIYSNMPIDINSADTAAFTSLPGIGSKLSQRIINFREKLGGFYAVEQIGETFGLPDSTFQKVKPQLAISNIALLKININTADIEEMKKHPYLRYVISNAIVRYRSQHGNFLAVEDIKKIMTITEDAFNKAAPYLTVDKP
jgi:competence protein ComEA